MMTIKQKEGSIIHWVNLQGLGYSQWVELCCPFRESRDQSQTLMPDMLSIYHYLHCKSVKKPHCFSCQQTILQHLFHSLSHAMPPKVAAFGLASDWRGMRMAGRGQNKLVENCQGALTPLHRRTTRKCYRLNYVLRISSLSLRPLKEEYHVPKKRGWTTFMPLTATPDLGSY